MIALVLAAAAAANLSFAGPPVAPTDESVVYEEAPEEVEQTVPARNDDAIEPVVIEAPPPPPASASEASQPPFVPTTQTSPDVKVEPAVLNLPPPPPPPDGSGRLVGGSVAIGLGLAAFGVATYEGTRMTGDRRFIAATFVPLGIAGVAAGTYLLVRGVKARRNFLDWRAYTERRSRPTGNGMIVGGVLSTVIGGVTLVTAVVEAREVQAEDSVRVPVIASVGGVALIAGVFQLTFGLLRRQRYRAWRQQTFLGSLSPTLSPLRAGASLGLAGRF